MLKILLLSLALNFINVYCQYAYGNSNGAKVITNLNGANYRVLSIVNPDFTYLIANPPGSAEPYKGFIWDLMTALAATANFTFTITDETDRIYGAPDASGKWNGMIGKLIANETDIVAVDLSITSQRLTVIDFPAPWGSYHVVTVTKPNATLDNIKYAVTKDTAESSFLSTSTTATEQAIWANIQANAPTSLVMTEMDGLNLVKQGGWALIAEDGDIVDAIKDENNAVAINGPALLTGHYALAVQLGSSLNKPLTVAILKLRETGQMQKMLTKWGFLG